MALPWGRAVAPSIQGPGARQKGRDWVKWGLCGAQVGSERRTYELLSLRPTIQGAKWGPSGGKLYPNVAKMFPQIAQMFSQGSHKVPKRGAFHSPKELQRAFLGAFKEKADLLQASVLP